MDSPKPLSAIGFLSIKEDPNYGLLGGYLIVSAKGRPLEFHCSAPFQTNRAQEILYGPTLRTFLYGELIGKALVEQAEISAEIILVEQPEILSLSEEISLPVVSLFNRDEPLKHSIGKCFSVGETLLTTAMGHEEKAEIVQHRLKLLQHDLDLTEPFERIHFAIAEAHRMSA